LTYKILIVDDEMTIRMGLKAMVSKLDNWQWVGEASNGIQAIEMIRQCRPDLILSDIRMPQMDGIAMLEQIRSIGSDSLLIFLTGYPDFTYAQKAIRYGAFDYLLKPMRAAEIMDVLRKAENQIAQKQRGGAEPGRTASDAEESESANRIRTVLYGGSWEADHPSLSIFRECAFVTAVNLCADIPLANEEDFGEMHERMSRRHTVYKALKEGRHDWIVLIGWKDGDDVNRRLRELAIEMVAPYLSRFGPTISANSRPRWPIRRKEWFTTMKYPVTIRTCWLYRSSWNLR
jgi:DNA-binding NarL/FixJ family response regulator